MPTMATIRRLPKTCLSPLGKMNGIQLGNYHHTHRGLPYAAAMPKTEPEPYAGKIFGKFGPKPMPIAFWKYDIDHFVPPTGQWYGNARQPFVDLSSTSGVDQRVNEASTVTNRAFFVPCMGEMNFSAKLHPGRD